MASTASLRVEIHAEDVVLALQRVSVGLSEYLVMLVRQAAEKTKSTERANAPEGVAGAAGQGIKNNIDIDYDSNGLKATIAPNSNVPYARYVEKGTRPHFPPAFPGSALDQWAEMHGLNAYAVAQSIAKKGTRPHPFVEPTYMAMSSDVPQLFVKGVERYIQRVMA